MNVFLREFSLFFLFFLIKCELNEDFYELLQISRHSDNREIRQAFKKLALIKHPDKNHNSRESHEDFLKITRAYEVLKDRDLREKYDLFGEKAFKETTLPRDSFHSWNYYNSEFGLYDNDLEILTLSLQDFQQSVLETSFVWFINFFSPFCSHCHLLARDWRLLAKELNHVIRIGAVNCEEERILCLKEGIKAFPSLLLYNSNRSLAKEKYSGKRDFNSLIEFVLKKLNSNSIEINEKNFKSFYLTKNPNFWWIFFVCIENKDCLLSRNQRILELLLKNVLNVAKVSCLSNNRFICDYFALNQSKVALFPNIIEDKHNYYEITSEQSLETRDLFANIISKLPKEKKLNSKQFKHIFQQLNEDKNHEKRETDTNPWIIEFTTNELEFRIENQIQSKKLFSLLFEENINFGKIFCEKEIKICEKFVITRFPSFLLVKSGPKYELFHGRNLAFDVVDFARDSLLSSSFESLDEKEFEKKVLNSKKLWIIDFFAPWCPPCLALLPRLRKVSRSVNHLVNFATIDCTRYERLCRENHIKSYPTIVLFNSSLAHHFWGSHSENELIDFIHETLNPLVIALNPKSFKQLVLEKNATQTWLIAFHVPKGCSPCQQLSGIWRNLAKVVTKDEKSVFLATIDCQKYFEFCFEENINSFPLIRIYVSRDSKYYSKDNKFYVFKGEKRDSNSLRFWIYRFLETFVEELENEEKYRKALKSRDIWLIDFHVPWCSHCLDFSPEFDLISKKLKNRVKCGKINCQQMRDLCRENSIKAYPTIKLFTKRDEEEDKGMEISSLNRKEILDFIEEKLQNIKIRDEL